MMESSQHTNLVLFDGVCNLCNGFVKFLIRRDREKAFSFGALQSEQAERLLSDMNKNAGNTLNTVIYIRHGQYYSQSTAVLNIFKDLGGWWKLTGALRIIPCPIRDRIYRWISNHRYRYWGKRQDCMVPTPDLKSRFLSV